MRKLIVVVAFLCCYGASLDAQALGTARIRQADGNVKTYERVRITFANKQMSVTSADGVGQLVIQKAGCTAIEKLLRCHPYDAIVIQHGTTQRLNILEGTAWLNPTSENEQLPQSATKLPPHGVLLTMKTKKGTTFSLTGTADQITK